MNQESLALINLDQKHEDMTVEHYASGSDNDNLSDTSLTIEDGNKDLTKGKGTPEINESVLESQNSSKPIDKTCKDTDEEEVIESKDFQNKNYLEEDKTSNKKTMARTNFNFEDDQDSSGENEDDDFDNLQAEEISVLHSDPGKRAIEEEYDNVKFYL